MSSVDILVNAEFNLNISYTEIEKLVSRILFDGLGDWCVITSVKLDMNNGQFSLGLIDINSNSVYKIGTSDVTKAIGECWLDFPYAINTTAGYDLQVDKLTTDDIDEIIQVAVYGCIKY